jgi:hypothetical protein
MGVCCWVIQRSSGIWPWHRHDTASTKMGNVGRPRMRQVCRSDHARSTQRWPFALHCAAHKRSWSDWGASESRPLRETPAPTAHFARRATAQRSRQRNGREPCGPLHQWQCHKVRSLQTPALPSLGWRLYSMGAHPLRHRGLAPRCDSLQPYLPSHASGKTAMVAVGSVSTR